MTTIRARIIGTGSFLPSNEVANDQLANVVDTSDEWIVQRAGIRSRRLAAEGETTADLSLSASHAALRAAGIDGHDLDVIVLATTTPDRTFPATAARVQAALGAHHGAAFDVQAVCSGFVYALSVADHMIRLGQARTALVIGAETFSRLLDSWTDRSTSCCSATALARSCCRPWSTMVGARSRGSCRPTCARTDATRGCSTPTAPLVYRYRRQGPDEGSSSVQARRGEPRRDR